MKKISLIILIMIVMLGASYGQSYKVVVNKSNAVTSLSKSELSDYFMKKITEYPDGTSVVPVDQKGTSLIRKSFTSDIHGKTVTAIRSYWQQIVFQGKGTPPVEKSTDADVLAYVANNSGAIGYVTESANTSSVKVVNIN